MRANIRLPIIIVESATDLERLAPPDAQCGPRVALRLPHVPTAQMRSWEQQLETLRLDCGCQATAIALGTFTIVGVGGLLWHAWSVPPSITAATIWLSSGAFIIGLVGSAQLGKWVGQRLRTDRYRRACAAIAHAARLSAATRPDRRHA